MSSKTKNLIIALLIEVLILLVLICLIYSKEPVYAQNEPEDISITESELVVIAESQTKDISELANEMIEIKKTETKRKIDEAKRIKKEKEEARQLYISQHSAGRGPYPYADSSYIDIVQMKTYGVRFFNGWKFTTYSEYVLPGKGLKIPGRHHDEYFVRDAEENICVASSDLKWGTYIMTPWGQGRVYDSGCAHGTIDIYVSEITFRSYGR